MLRYVGQIKQVKFSKTDVVEVLIGFVRCYRVYWCNIHFWHVKMCRDWSVQDVWRVVSSCIDTNIVLKCI
jgi:hypothetical protein